jgi:hypothetical protein
MSTKFKVGDIICDDHDPLSVIDVKTTKQGTQYYILESCEYNMINTYQTKYVDNKYSIQPKFKIGDIIRSNGDGSGFDRIVVGMVTSSTGTKSYLTEFVNSGDQVDAIKASFVDKYCIKIGEHNADRATDTRTA